MPLLGFGVRLGHPRALAPPSTQTDSAPAGLSKHRSARLGVECSQERLSPHRLGKGVPERGRGRRRRRQLEEGRGSGGRLAYQQGRRKGACDGEVRCSGRRERGDGQGWWTGVGTPYLVLRPLGRLPVPELGLTISQLRTSFCSTIPLLGRRSGSRHGVSSRRRSRMAS